MNTYTYVSGTAVSDTLPLPKIDIFTMRLFWMGNPVVYLRDLYFYEINLDLPWRWSKSNTSCELTLLTAAAAAILDILLQEGLFWYCGNGFVTTKYIYSLWPKTTGGTWFETSLFYEIFDKKKMGNNCFFFLRHINFISKILFLSDPW